MTTELVTYVRVRDNFDGTLLGPDEGWHVQFTFEGQDYQLDLTEHNRELYDADMRKWAEKAVAVGKLRKLETARRIGSEAEVVQMPPEIEEKQTPPPPRRINQKIKRPNIKQWAQENGYGPQNGRVSIEVEQAYDLAHGKAAA